MKTALQELIEQIEKLEIKSGKLGAFNLVGKTTSALLKLAKAYEGKDKQDIIDAYNEGYGQGSMRSKVDGKNYFNQTLKS